MIEKTVMKIYILKNAIIDSSRPPSRHFVANAIYGIFTSIFDTFSVGKYPSSIGRVCFQVNRIRFYVVDNNDNNDANR